MRPDRLTSELTRFVESNIGAEYIRQPSFDIRKAIDESSPSTPIFFTLFPGVDPTRWVEEHAKNVANKEFLNISMGQGQEDRAENSVHEFSERGGWIFLQNIHLMQAWLPRLEHTLEQVRWRVDCLIVRWYSLCHVPPDEEQTGSDDHCDCGMDTNLSCILFLLFFL